MWPRSERYGSQRQDRPCRSGGAGSSCSSSVKAGSVLIRVRELEAAAREHREVVAGTELIFRHQHPSPQPPQLLHRHQADPQLEPEAGAGEAPGAAERIRDHAAHPGGMSTVAPSPPNAYGRSSSRVTFSTAVMQAAPTRLTSL